MHFLGKSQLTFSIILMLRLSCAKFVFLCSKDVNKVMSIRLQLVSCLFQGGSPISISSVVEQFQDNCTGKVKFIQMLSKHR